MLWSPGLEHSLEFQNTFNDSSGHARHADQGGGAPAYTDGVIGRCWACDGIIERETSSFSFTAGDVIVIAFRALFSQVGVDSQVIYGAYQDADYGFNFHQIVALTEFRAFASNPTQFKDAGAGFITWEEWHHLGVIADHGAALQYFYKDGVLFQAASALAAATVPTKDMPKTVGHYSSGGFRMESGSLVDDIRTYVLPASLSAACYLANMKRLMMGMSPTW